MKKYQKGNIWIIVLVVLALIVAGYFWINSDIDSKLSEVDENVMEKNEDMAQNEVMMEDGTKSIDNEVMEKNQESGAVSKSGSYEAYSANKLALADKGDVVLFFHASWCPFCRAAEADINKNLGSIPEGVHILKTDYDKETALKQKYGVTTQHTFVQVDSKGNLIKKWSGSETLAAIVKNIQ